MKQVLFLCSANYYRSRFAEHLFNWLAPQRNLPWRADSRGLKVDRWGDLGAISPYTVETLELRGLSINGNHRRPQQLVLEDLTKSKLVIALKEAEHRAMMADLFPDWEDAVEYWHVHDLDCAEPEEALPILENHVQDLVDRLAIT
ncbi:MAG: low molecular weight phosphatase family protein [Planctomycetes bacterium]|nr:low molecular weight phosphatase family protein [Planctomycetota bacterium]MBL7041499.1 low molecular weight phosphatase family protein [Pirellulaceae bacterium]